MTKIIQDFTIYAGDDAAPIITVYDSSDVALDISTVTDITWTMRRSLSTAVILTKKKSISSGITFVNTGTDGQFQINLTATDTTSLSGYYLHQATLTDAFGKVTTVTVGRVQVGDAPAWTYSGDPTASNKDAIRFLIGDTITGDPQLYDPEIEYSYTLRGNVWGAAAQCCRALAAQMSRQADSVQGELRTMYSARSKAYSLRAHEYDEREVISSGGGLAYAGGISISDKQTQLDDTDRVRPAFNRGMTDNNIPVTPGSNEYPSADEVT